MLYLPAGLPLPRGMNPSHYKMQAASLKEKAESAPGNFRNEIAGRKCRFQVKSEARDSGPPTKGQRPQGPRAQVLRSHLPPKPAIPHCKGQPLLPGYEAKTWSRLSHLTSSCFITSNSSTHPVGFTFKPWPALGRLPTPSAKGPSIHHLSQSHGSCPLTALPALTLHSSSSTGSQRNPFKQQVKTQQVLCAKFSNHVSSLSECDPTLFAVA